MHTIILGDGHLGPRRRDRGARAAASARVARPAGRRTGTTPRPSRVPTSSSSVARPRGRRPTSTRRSTPACRRFVIATTGWDADRGRASRRPSAAARRAVASRQLQPRRRAVRPAGRGGGRAVRRGRGFDPYLVEWHRRAQGRPPVGHGPRPRPAHRRPPPAARRAPTTSRSSRSAPGPRPGCTWSASMPRARPSSCGSPPVIGPPTRPGPRRRRLARSARHGPPGIHPFDAVVDELLAATGDRGLTRPRTRHRPHDRP